MKKIIGIAVVLLLALSVNAQKEKPMKDPAEKAAMESMKMKKQLNLTDDQFEKVGKMNETHHTEMQALRQQKIESREEMKAQRDNMQNDYASQLKGVLSPEQFIQWQEIQQEKMDKREGRVKERRQIQKQ